jgi:hypothetical protein
MHRKNLSVSGKWKWWRKWWQWLTGTWITPLPTFGEAVSKFWSCQEILSLLKIHITYIYIYMQLLLYLHFCYCLIVLNTVIFYNGYILSSFHICWGKNGLKKFHMWWKSYVIFQVFSFMFHNINIKLQLQNGLKQNIISFKFRVNLIFFKPQH